MNINIIDIFFLSPHTWPRFPEGISAHKPIDEICSYHAKNVLFFFPVSSACPSLAVSSMKHVMEEWNMSCTRSQQKKKKSRYEMSLWGFHMLSTDLAAESLLNFHHWNNPIKCYGCSQYTSENTGLLIQLQSFLIQKASAEAVLNSECLSLRFTPNNWFSDGHFCVP